MGKYHQSIVRNKMKFILSTLNNIDMSSVMMAYNAMKQQAYKMQGVGMGNAETKKMNFIKRLMNSGLNLQTMAINSLKGFLKTERDQEAEDQRKHENEMKEKGRIIKLIMDSNLRYLAAGFRKSLLFTRDEMAKENNWAKKQRGMINRIMSANSRLLSMAFNKLVSEYNYQQSILKNKMKFILLTLNNKDMSSVMMAYNGMKQQAHKLQGLGMGNAEMKKMNFIKKIMNSAYNLQTMAINSLKEFLKNERDQESEDQRNYENEMKEKGRIIRLISDSNLRLLAAGFRKSLLFTKDEMDKESNLVKKQRGIFRKMLDANI